MPKKARQRTTNGYRWPILHPLSAGVSKSRALRFHIRTRVHKLHHLQAFQQILRDLISLSLFHHVPSPCLADHGPPSTIHCSYLCSPAIQQTPLFAQSPAPVGLAKRRVNINWCRISSINRILSCFS